MKVSTVSIFLAALLSTPQSSIARSIPVRRGDLLHESDRHIIVNPDSDDPWYNVNTKCGTADCRNLAIAISDHDITKRAPPPIKPPVRGGGGAGAGAGGDGAPGSAGRTGAGVGAGASGAGRTGVGADGTINPGSGVGGLDEFGAPIGGTKRPLSPDVEGGVGQGDPKEPKVGAGPGSEDGSVGSSPNRAAPDDPFTGDNLAENQAAGGVLDVKTKGYTFNPEPTTGDVLDFKVLNSAQFQVARIRIDKTQKSIIADDLRFDDDATVGRARAWEVEMTAFKHEGGLEPSELKKLDYPETEEAATQTALDGVIASKGGIEEPFTVSRGDPDFDTIMATPLGKSGQRIVDNTPIGKQIESVEVRPGDPDIEGPHGLTLNFGTD